MRKYVITVLLALVALATSACSEKGGVKGSKISYSEFNEWYTSKVSSDSGDITQTIEADINADLVFKTSSTQMLGTTVPGSDVNSNYKIKYIVKSDNDTSYTVIDTTEYNKNTKESCVSREEQYLDLNTGRAYSHKGDAAGTDFDKLVYGYWSATDTELTNTSALEGMTQLTDLMSLDKLTETYSDLFNNLAVVSVDNESYYITIDCKLIELWNAMKISQSAEEIIKATVQETYGQQNVQIDIEKILPAKRVLGDGRVFIQFKLNKETVYPMEVDVSIKDFNFERADVAEANTIFALIPITKLSVNGDSLLHAKVYNSVNNDVSVPEQLRSIEPESFDGGIYNIWQQMEKEMTGE